jgi:hypothetical protein
MATTSVKTLEAHQEKINTLTALNKEKDNLLAQALEEINCLRNSTQRQALRLQMFDDLKELLYTRPGSERNGMAMGEDVAYTIRKHLNQ